MTRGERNVKEVFLLTGNAAVHHPADHAEQEEQITHEVPVIPTSCGAETNMSCTTHEFSAEQQM